MLSNENGKIYKTERLQHVKQDASSAGPPVNNMVEGNTRDLQRPNLLVLLFAICVSVSQWVTWPINFWQLQPIHIAA